MNKLKLAGCIILDFQDRILLLHRNTIKRQQWEIPGGKVEPGESTQQAASRELKEELGVNVEIIKLLGHTEFTESNQLIDYYWYRAEIKSGEPKIVEFETFDDMGYFTAAKLNDIWEQLSPNTQNFIFVSKPK